MLPTGGVPLLALSVVGLSIAATQTLAEPLYKQAIVVVRALDEAETAVGEVILRDSPHGMLVIPSMTGLTPGPHATHIHENPSCGPSVVDGVEVPGGAAGGHYDPAGTGVYKGPYRDDGALGDLPNLFVEADGRAMIPVLAPRLKVEDVAGRSLMIHAGADRYGPTYPTSGSIGEENNADHSHMAMGASADGDMAMDGADRAGGDDTPMAMGGAAEPAEDDADGAETMVMAEDPGTEETAKTHAMGAMPGMTGGDDTPDPHGGMRMYCGLVGPVSIGVASFED